MCHTGRFHIHYLDQLNKPQKSPMNIPILQVKKQQMHSLSDLARIMQQTSKEIGFEPSSLPLKSTL